MRPWRPPIVRPLFCPECKQPFQPLGRGHLSACSTGQNYRLPLMINEGWKLLVFGGRDVPPGTHPRIYGFLDDVLAKHPDLVLMHGGAQGTDFAAGGWAKENGVAQEIWPSGWSKQWRAAPLWRNAEMAHRKPRAGAGFIGPCTKDGCRATYLHGSHGSVDMAARALALGVPVFPHVRGGLDQLANWMVSGDGDQTGKYKPKGDGS